MLQGKLAKCLKSGTHVTASLTCMHAAATAVVTCKMLQGKLAASLKSGTRATAAELRQDATKGLLHLLPTAQVKVAAQKGKDLDADPAAVKRMKAKANNNRAAAGKKRKGGGRAGGATGSNTAAGLRRGGSIRQQ
jgi:hypothetical protein